MSSRNNAKPPKVLRCFLNSCFLLLFAFFYGRDGYSQGIVWQDQIGHPFRNNTHFNYNDGISGIATFSEGLVVAVNGYAFETLVPTSNVHKQCYIRYYDYDGNLLNEDTVGGMVADGALIKLTDSTFLARVDYTFIRPGNTVYDTGQIGGYLLREYTSSGHLLWQRRMWAGSSSSSYDLYAREGGSFALLSTINIDHRGVDSSFVEFFLPGGVPERQAYFTDLGGQGLLTRVQNPERYLSVHSRQLGNPGPWLYTVAHYDSALNMRREDTIGVLGRSYYNGITLAQPGGKYIAILRQVTDTIRNRLFFFDHPGRPYKSQLIDSGGINFIPLSDGGALAVGGKTVTNVARVIDSLSQRGLPYILNGYFQRLDYNWHPVWTIDILDWVNDSITYSYTPVAAIPYSPEDAIYYGSRVVKSTVHSEPSGTFALIGRINGVGQIFDPTALKGPREKVSGLQAVLYPNPASDRIFIDSERPLAYQILTVIGETVRQGLIDKANSISIHDLQPGIYQVVLSGSGQRLVKRFVKQ